MRLLTIGVFSLAPVYSVNAQPFTPDAHTILLLHFDENANGAQGESPDSLPDLAYKSGVFGKCVSMRSTSLLYFNRAGNLDGHQGTLEFWFRPGWNGNDSRSHYILACGGEGGALFGKDSANNWRCIFNRFASGGHPEVGIAVPVGGWTAERWHHCAFTWASSSLKLYIDGVLLQQGTPAYAPPPLSDSLFQIGGDISASNLAGGDLDELRISDVARTSSEIQASFSAARAGVTAPSYGEYLAVYSPDYQGGCVPPGADFFYANAALGAPDGVFASTGAGGLLEIKFLTSKLTNSGNNWPDLTVHEVGGIVEQYDIALHPYSPLTSGAQLAELGLVDSNEDRFYEIGRMAGVASLDIDGQLGHAVPAYSLFFDAIQITGVTDPYTICDTAPGPDIDAVEATCHVQTPTGTGDDARTPASPRLALRVSGPADSRTLNASVGVAADAVVSLRLFDVAGRRIANVFEGRLSPGVHAVALEPNRFPGGRPRSGIYVLRLSSGTEQRTAKVVLIR